MFAFLKRFLPQDGCPDIPNPPAPLAQKETSPPISCFAQGIIKSLVEQPSLWKVVKPSGYYQAGWYPVMSIRHSTTKVVIEGQTNRYGSRSCLPGCARLSSLCIWEHTLTKEEITLIAQTIEAHPLGQLKKSIAIEKAHKARLAAAEEHFTKLGCPTL